MMQPELILSASERRLALFQAGEMSLNTAGAGSSAGLYQPIPKPSALMRVGLSMASTAWWIRLLTGL